MAKGNSDEPRDRGEVWLLQLSEQLPIDPDYRPMRTSEHAEELLRRGYRVRWFTGRFDHSRKLNRKERRREVEVKPGYTLVLLRGPSYLRNFSPWRVLHHTVAALDFLITAWRYQVPKFLIISYPAPELAAAGALWCGIGGIPFVLDVRDAWPTIFRTYRPYGSSRLVGALVRWYTSLYAFILAQASAVTASSHRQLLDAENYADREVLGVGRLVSHIGHPAPILPINETLGAYTREHPLRVVFVGSLSNSYDLSLLIGIARRLRDNGERRISFVIVGDGENRSGWEREAQELGADIIKFRGWLGRGEVDQELQRSHVGALLYFGGSLDYSVPNKFAEYLAYGLPLLSNMKGEIRDLINGAQIGFTISNASVDAAAAWLSELADDPSRLLGLRTRARELFDRSFESRKLSARFVDFVEEEVSVWQGRDDRRKTL